LAGRLLKPISHSLKGSDKFCLQLAQMDELACFAPGTLALGASGYVPGKIKYAFLLADRTSPFFPFPFMS